ncbi:MAG: DNA polymerase III subunit delta [Firmicutes bacterium]|nr:DNA polymerase III subunit delta [Bacillota bacterium]
MDFITLRSALKNGTALIYALHGTDIFLINKAVEMISAGAVIDRFNDENSVQEIITSANTFDMFGGKRVVLVRGVDEKFLKNKDFTKYVASPNPNTTLILVTTTDKVKGVEVVNCSPLQGDILFKLIAKQFQDKGKNITSTAATQLARLCNNDFAKISNEIIKLVNFSEKELIDVELVEELVSKEEEFQTYEFSNAVLKRDFVTANKILETLAVSGVEDYAVFGGLVGTLRRVFYSLLTKSSQDNVAKFLKVNPYSIMYTRRDYKHLTGRIAILYSSALDLEYKIKSGQMSARSAIDLIHIMAVLDTPLDK